MNSSQISQSLEILLVEDNPGDVFLITSTLGESSVPHSLHQVADGELAVTYLRQEGEYARAPRPHLILLDLNLPRKNGFEVLTEIKRDENLKEIPVVVLTSSRAEQDILNSYRLYASCYITKPFEINEFMEAVKSIESFWFKIVQLPSA